MFGFSDGIYNRDYAPECPEDDGISPSSSGVIIIVCMVCSSSLTLGCNRAAPLRFWYVGLWRNAEKITTTSNTIFQ